MKIGDRVKVMRNDWTAQHNVADRYGHITMFIDSMDGEITDREPDLWEHALIAFNDFSYKVPIDCLKLIEGGGA